MIETGQWFSVHLLSHGCNFPCIIEYVNLYYDEDLTRFSVHFLYLNLTFNETLLLNMVKATNTPIPKTVKIFPQNAQNKLFIFKKNTITLLK